MNHDNGRDITTKSQTVTVAYQSRKITKRRTNNHTTLPVYQFSNVRHDIAGPQSSHYIIQSTNLLLLMQIFKSSIITTCKAHDKKIRSSDEALPDIICSK